MDLPCAPVKVPDRDECTTTTITNTNGPSNERVYSPSGSVPSSKIDKQANNLNDSAATNGYTVLLGGSTSTSSSVKSDYSTRKRNFSQQTILSSIASPEFDLIPSKKARPNQSTYKMSNMFDDLGNEMDGKSSTSDVLVVQRDEVEPLGHQVAGHLRIEMLKHKKLGHVLKPVQMTPVGRREKEFYSKITTGRGGQSNKTGRSYDLVLLERLIPPYFGLAVLNRGSSPTSVGNDVSDSTNNEYLILGDIIRGFQTPCIMDLKIGRRTWDPEATKEKIILEDQKFTATKEAFGLSLTGMIVRDLVSGEVTKTNSSFGKTLTPRKFIEMLAKFINYECGKAFGAHQLIARAIVKKLIKVKEYFCAQQKYLFYSSSLLIAYDLDHVRRRVEAYCHSQSISMPSLHNSLEESSKDNNLEGTSTTSSSSKATPSPSNLYQPDQEWLRVWMIDFAHVYESKDNKVDSNYICGLNNIIRIMTAYAIEDCPEKYIFPEPPPAV